MHQRQRGNPPQPGDEQHEGARAGSITCGSESTCQRPDSICADSAGPGNWFAIKQKKVFFSLYFVSRPPKNGNDIAQHALGLFSMEEVIVPKDEVEGQTAQSASASFYASGLVVAADNVEAFKRMLISGAHNDATTKEAFEAVERLLIRELRIIGQHRAKGFIPH